ncbi:MAG: YggT family protein [Caldilineaceae bacterium]
MGALFGLLALVIQLYTFLILARVLITWIPNLDPYHPAVQLLRQVTDPVLEPAQRLIPPLGMIDISPIIVLFALSFISRMLEDLARQF